MKRHATGLLVALSCCGEPSLGHEAQAALGKPAPEKGLPAEAPSPKRELALALAKTCVNESGWSSKADCAMIWQTVRAHGRTDENRLSWLKRHSHTIFSEEPVRRGNARWTRDLNWDGEKPKLWPSGVPWERFAPKWEGVLGYAHGLVNGAVKLRPCPRGVITWGGDMDIQSAIKRGLAPLACRGTINTGFRRRP